MGKKEKKLSPEEEEARRAEERRAVQNAYLGIYKEAKSRRGKTLDDVMSPKAAVFPIPKQPYTTTLLGAPSEMITKMNTFSQKQKEAITAGMRKIRSGGTCHKKNGPDTICVTAPGTLAEVSEGVKSYVESLMSIWHKKQGGILEELEANLSVPVPSSDARALLAEIADRLHDTYQEACDGESCLETLIMTLYTMDGTDIDRMLSYPNVPPPYRADFQSVRDAWTDYTPKNPTIHAEILHACSELYSDPCNPKSMQAASKWIRFIGILMGLSEGRPSEKLYKGVWGAEIDVNLLKNTHIGWVTPLSVSSSERVAEDFSDGSSGTGIVFTFMAKEGVPLYTVSQYPDEQEILLPLGSVLKVVSVTPSGNDTSSVVNTEVVSCLSSLSNEVQLFQSQAIADARIAGEWLSQLAALRGDDDNASNKLQSSDSSAEESEDDGGFLTQNEIKLLDSISSVNMEGGGKGKFPVKLTPVPQDFSCNMPDEESCKALLLRLREEYMSKKGDAVDELVTNLRSQHQRGTADHKREGLQRLSVMAKLLHDRSKTHFPDSSCVDSLVMWLYTSHGVNIDAMMGFEAPVFPVNPDDPNYDNLLAKWEEYIKEYRTEDYSPDQRTRNGAIFCDINWALRIEGAPKKNGKGNPKATLIIRKWCKFISTLLNILSRSFQEMEQPLYRGFGGQSDSMFSYLMKQAPGAKLYWPAVSSCAHNRDVAVSYVDGSAANAQTMSGYALLFEIKGASCGAGLDHISQYPGETEHALPMTELVIEDTAVEEEITGKLRAGGGTGSCGVIHVKTRPGFVKKHVNDLLYFARADARRTSKRVLRTYNAVRMLEKPTELMKARAELVDAVDDMELDALFELTGHVQPIVKEVVENARWVLEPDGREVHIVNDTLDSLARNKGPAALVEKIRSWTLDCTKRNDLPDETTTKRRLHGFCSGKKTKPEALRREAPEAEDLARWVRCVHAYAVQLIECVRSKNVKGAVKKKQSKA